MRAFLLAAGIALVAICAGVFVASAFGQSVVFIRPYASAPAVFSETPVWSYGETVNTTSSGSTVSVVWSYGEAKIYHDNQ